MSKKFNIVNLLTAFVVLCLLSATSVSAQDISAKVEEYMNAAAKVDRFSGSILVAKDGKPIFSKGYGMANVELDVPNTPATIFRLGSITKQFTSMAIMQLQERGKLNVNDPICKYMENCPEIWQPITIKNLLTHTSGITNYTNFPEFVKTATLPTSTAQMIALLRDKPLDFAPNEKYTYSNSGYFFLGSIIEKVSGKTYADFLQENIFTPLGMKQSGYEVSSEVLKNRAAGYARQSGKTINAAYLDMTIPYAAGSLYSTTGDLLIWDQALYTEKLVSRKSMDEMFTPFKNGYGYGWGIGKRFDKDVISHSGGIFGFATYISRFPADRVTIVVLSNIQGAGVGKVANDLAAITFGAAYEIPKERKEIAVDPKILEKYAGQYQLMPINVVMDVTFENGKLLGQVGSQPKFGLLAESETVFFSRDVNLLITFVKDAQGQTTGLLFSQGGGNIQAKKIK